MSFSELLGEDYLDIARENEPVFRAVLRDLRDNRAERPMGNYIPANLDTESDLERIFETYTVGSRYGQFTILNFTRPYVYNASIAFENVAIMSGGGAELFYRVEGENVTYVGAGLVWNS